MRLIEAAQRRKHLRRRTAIQYAKIARLLGKLKIEIIQKEKYRKKCKRQNKRIQSSAETEVPPLLKNVKSS